MPHKSKCPYCAHMFNMREALSKQISDYSRDGNNSEEIMFDFVRCPECFSWLNKESLK